MQESNRRSPTPTKVKRWKKKIPLCPVILIFRRYADGSMSLWVFSGAYLDWQGWTEAYITTVRPIWDPTEKKIAAEKPRPTDSKGKGMSPGSALILTWIRWIFESLHPWMKSVISVWSHSLIPTSSICLICSWMCSVCCRIQIAECWTECLHVGSVIWAWTKVPLYCLDPPLHPQT